MHRLPQERPHRIPDVLNGALDPRGDPHATRLLAHQRDVAERPARLGAGVGGRHPGGQQDFTLELFLGEGGGAGSGVRDAGSGFGSSDGGPVWRLENAANFSQQGIRRKRLLNESQSGLENAMPDDGIIGVA